MSDAEGGGRRGQRDEDRHDQRAVARLGADARTYYRSFYGAMDDNYQTHLPTLERMTESVGMSNAISDEAAIKFAASFYRPLGFGQSVNSAFLFGCNDIGLQNIPEEATPKLKYAPGVDPAKVYLTKT